MFPQRGRSSNHYKTEVNIYNKTDKQQKGMFYIAQYPVRWTAQSALHLSSPGRSVHSDNSASLGSILAMQQLRNDYSVTFPITAYSQVLIYTAESTEAS